MNATPFITVLIPALNEASHIEGCLAALRQQTYPRDRYEVVVVDNGSTDNTAELVQATGVRVLREERKSAYWARNLGIANTSGDYLAFTDADCLADRDWLTKLTAKAIESNASVVGGMIQYEMVTDTLGNRLLIETHGADQIRRNIEKHYSVAGGNMFVRREAFDTLGLFNVIAWGSDIEFSQRAAAVGRTVAFAENAVVRHQCDLSNWEYWRRSYETRYGQVLLFDPRSGFRAAIGNCTKLPWRPGFRSGRNRYQSDSVAPAPLLTDWLYRWGNRWMEFFGEQTALMTKKPA
ncbi:glycosyltransferase [Stieleria sp. ICT_E10.1]|uniref:glycosyltransferase n=1 Tax=Stieleria sedimenti TaxID=2976331 RepID=UPI00217F46C0|nr:glycosyltransferase [Stieleria sedimenti]MCS7469432.1 glycosyltransferase [Stieleria sedimenti]